MRRTTGLPGPEKAVGTWQGELVPPKGTASWPRLPRGWVGDDHASINRLGGSSSKAVPWTVGPLSRSLVSLSSGNRFRRRGGLVEAFGRVRGFCHEAPQAQPLFAPTSHAVLKAVAVFFASRVLGGGPASARTGGVQAWVPWLEETPVRAVKRQQAPASLRGLWDACPERDSRDEGFVETWCVGVERVFFGVGDWVAEDRVAPGAAWSG